MPHGRPSVGGAGGAPPRITVGPVKRRPCQDIRGPQKLVSYQIPTANPEKELGVIRAIIAREQSIAELLAHVSQYGPRMITNAGTALNIKNACFGALDQGTTDLLLRVRVTGVMVCEAVQDWRFQLTLPRPFVWQRKNYVQGMACDVDFLHFDKTVSTVLGNGRTKRNPFVTEGRNINELAQCQWGDDPSAEPKSLLVSGVDAMRLKAAARVILEEEMRCGKADAKMTTPAWYIQRKKRMLAMGINLQAGADEPAENKSPKRRSKPPPGRRKRREMEDDGEQLDEKTTKQTSDIDDGSMMASPQKKNGKKGKKKKRLLEVRVETPVPVQTVPIHLPGCKRSHQYGRTRDGRMFLSRAIAWLLPPKKFTSMPGNGAHAFQGGNRPQSLVKVSAAQGTSMTTTTTTEQKEGSTTTTNISQRSPLPPEDIDSRIEIHVEAFLPNRSARNGCFGPAVNGSRIVITLKELESGGFVHVDQISMGLSTMDAPLAVLLPIEMKGRSSSKNKGANKVKKNPKRGPRAALITRRTDLKNKKEAAQREQKARVLRVEAAMSFLSKRLVPTLDGGLAWRRHGPVVTAAKRRELRSIGASLSGGVDASFFPGAMGLNQSVRLRSKGARRKVENTTRVALRSDAIWHHREALRIGRFWCSVRSWIPWQDGGGLELEITTVSSPVTTKRLSLDLGALVRLLGAEFFGKGPEDLPKEEEKEKEKNIDSNSNSNSRPSSRGAGSRPASRGAGSRPSSRGSGSRPSSRGVGSRPSSRGAGSRPESRPGSRHASSRPSSRGAGRRREKNRSNKRPSYVMASGVKIAMSDAPPLDVLSKKMLTKCVVVVETPNGPEFYAQAPTYAYHENTPSIRLPTPNASSDIIAAAAAAAASTSKRNKRMWNSDKGESASGTMLGGQRVNLSASDEKEKKKDDIEPRFMSDPAPPAILRPLKSKEKIWQGGAMVGGLHFLVDVHLSLATGEMHIQATYPTSGSTISLFVSAQIAASCVAKGMTTSGEKAQSEMPSGVLSSKLAPEAVVIVSGPRKAGADAAADVKTPTKEVQDGTQDEVIWQDAIPLSLQPRTTIKASTSDSTNQEIARAVVQRLDLDYNEPPRLILRSEDNSDAPLTGPLVVLMASSLTSPDNRAPKAFSPMMPVFAPQAIEKKSNENVISTTAKGSSHAPEEEKERELSRAEANVNFDGHRKALASTKTMAGGGLMVTLLPVSPTKKSRPESELSVSL